MLVAKRAEEAAVEAAKKVVLCVFLHDGVQAVEEKQEMLTSYENAVCPVPTTHSRLTWPANFGERGDGRARVGERGGSPVAC